MIVGMSVPAFTLLHVVISLIGIASGIVVVIGMLASYALPRWTALFLVTTILTSATGFLFHSAKIGPPHIVGAISLVVLAVACVAIYGKHLVGGWRTTFGVVQAFQKIPVFNALAPTGTELPFKLAQGVVLLAFIAMGFSAVRRFRFAGVMAA